jgi:carbon-monoxide dehydrogenase medium subunit
MYPRNFAYHRATSLTDAVGALAQMGEEARLLAGGQSLIPLMKLRLANPAALVDIGHIAGIDYVQAADGGFSVGALARHTQIAASEFAREVPIVHDCAAGIADVQVRNWGTLVGSVAEADPTGDWAPVLLALGTDVVCMGSKAERTRPLASFIKDAFTTELAPGEIIREVRIKKPAAGSGGAYIAFKRSAPVYASASVAVQLAIADAVCTSAAIYVGAVGLTPVRAADAEKTLQASAVNEAAIARAAEAAVAGVEPQSDQRGSTEYKKQLVRALVAEAIAVAARRAAGEHLEVSHHYA